MPEEAVGHLACRPGRIYVDCTLGGSGHAAAICEKIAPDGLLIGIDQDEDAVKRATEILRAAPCRTRLFHDNFVHLPTILSHLNISAVDGILLDLGISSYQLFSSGRGFSFDRDEPLDMRMNARATLTAADIVNTSSRQELADLFKRYGEERWATAIARKIDRARRQRPITTSRELAGIIAGAVPAKARHLKIHPATRTFMALRIAVNQELAVLERFMADVADYLNPGGRLCVISFHSLEDRIVKQQMKRLAGTCTCPPGLPRCGCGARKRVKRITRKPLRPTAQEIEANPPSRSARLRVMEKL